MNEGLELILMMIGYFALVELFLWCLFKSVLTDWKEVKRKLKRKWIKRKIAKRKRKR